jgi:hypothetical protein
MGWSVHPKIDAALPTFHRLYQAAEQSEVGAAWKVVELDSEPDGEDFGVIKVVDDSVEDDSEHNSVENDSVENDSVENDSVENDSVENDSVENDSVEDDLVGDARSEAVHRLPCLSPLSNLHVDLSP